MAVEEMPVSFPKLSANNLPIIYRFSGIIYRFARARGSHRRFARTSMACKNGCAACPVLVAAKMEYFMLALTRFDLIYPYYPPYKKHCGFGLGAIKNIQRQSMTRDFALIQFDDFSRAATEKPSTYGYQWRLACSLLAEPYKPDTLCGGTDRCSQLNNISTVFGGICDQQ